MTRTDGHRSRSLLPLMDESRWCLNSLRCTDYTVLQCTSYFGESSLIMFQHYEYHYRVLLLDETCGILRETLILIVCRPPSSALTVNILYERDGAGSLSCSVPKRTRTLHAVLGLGCRRHERTWWSRHRTMRDGYE